MKTRLGLLLPLLYGGALAVPKGIAKSDLQPATDAPSPFRSSNICTENIPRWNLDDHFSTLRPGEGNTIDDTILDALENRAASFAKQYKGSLNESLGEALEEYEQIDEELDKVVLYWSLKTSQNVTDDQLRRERSNVDTRVSRLRADYLTFLPHEIAHMTPEALQHLVDIDERLRRYRSFVDKLRVRGKFMLGEPIEKALNIRAPWTSPSIAVKAYRKQLSSATFRVNGDSEALSFARIKALLRSEDQDTRRRAQQAIKDGLVENRIDKFAALALNMVVGSWCVETRERGYRSPRSRRNELNRVSDDIVDALIAAVKTDGVELARRAMLLKKRLLIKTDQIRTFSFVDRLAPVMFNNDSMTDADAYLPWCSAVAIVKEGYASFSPVFVRLFEKLLDEKRIDAAPEDGKQTGAFCSGGTPSTGPFILLSHTGVKANAQTLAHEAGHAIHFMLAYPHGNLQYHPSLPLAETASIMGETIVFYHLLEKTKSPHETLQMLLEHVDSLVGTIIRQISFDRFEELVHEARFSGLVTDEDFDRYWLQSTKEFFGDEGDIFDDYVGIEKDWSSVHHFTKAPFYVYSYALADLLVGSLLVARAQSNPRDFEKKIIAFLEAGDTANLDAALRPFGLDPTTPSFWKEALEMRLGSAIEKAENLSASLGYN